MPTPILQYSIHNILQYISPPSLILEPLPQHIISKSLHQRHHFLSIDPSSPEYLCWPSPNTTAVIHLLESFVRPVDDDEYATYPVRYSSDGEWIYAHVHVRSGPLRIVFQWDETDGWKFHDANLMPFPRGSCKSLRAAISGSALGQAKPMGDHSLAIEEDDIDTYWDAYGQAIDEDSDIPEVKDDNRDSTDDSSYWAQYASGQGSGDLTQTSPLPSTCRQSHLVSNVEPPYKHDSTSDSTIEFSHPSFRFRSPIEGPSPGQLIDLLNAVSPRSSSPPFSNDSNSTTPSPPSAESRTIFNSHPVFLNGKDITVRDGEFKVKGGPEEAEEPLRQSIRGILQLWKAGRRKNLITTPPNQQEENEFFLRIVRQIVEES